MGQSPQPSDRQGPRGFGYVVITIVVIGGIVYGLNSLLHKESKTPPPDIENAITNPVAPPTVSKASSINCALAWAWRRWKAS